MLPDSTTGWPSESDGVQKRGGEGERKIEGGRCERREAIQKHTRRERAKNLLL